MITIRVLSDDLVNRIAAGEVVERPASVVKELVENSLDAGAARISVEMSNGGRSLVRVADDGCGMVADDALLALERHATSKIGAAGDLENILTLGFRGEALPSIGAVSRLSVLTSADPAQGGVRVTVEGGRILAVDGAPRARGTTVEVRDLFFNTPARRKFLRAPETELRHAQEYLWGAMLARPEVGFVLRHGQRTLLDSPPANDEAQRFSDLLRKRGGGSVRRAATRGGGVEVSVLVASGSGARRPSLTLIVNGRPVRDRLLVGAAMRVLRGAGAGAGGARLALFLRVPPDAVDVNVHPAKAEVRFANAGAVFATVERAIRQAVVATHGHVEPRRVESLDPRVAEPSSGAYGKPGAPPHEGAAAPLFTHPVYGEMAEGAMQSTEADPNRYRPAAAGAGHPASRSGARSGPPDTPFGRLIGQYRSSFILLEDELGLVIVDQHVAHERVLYDRIRRRMAGDPVVSQRLLAPVLVAVDEAHAAALPRVQEVLGRVGVEAEPFGPDTIRLAALPPELEAEAAGDLVREILERATALDGVPEQVADEVADEVAAALSCRAAVKVNHPLATEEQRALLADLRATDDPYRCPHGRPIILRLSQEEMERRLGRR